MARRAGRRRGFSSLARRGARRCPGRARSRSRASPRASSRSSGPTPSGCPKSDLPKLFANAEPGAILIGAQREICRCFPNQTEITVEGSHLIQEDPPHEIGQAVADWYRRLP
jgi:hypothetical protein